MEPEDLPWPGELEEEEPEAEEGEDEAEGEGAEEEEEEEETETETAEENLEDEVVVVQEVEDERGPDSDCDYRCVPEECRHECQERECTDDEDDEGATAWLQACPDRILPARSIPQPRPPHAKPCPPHQMTHYVRQQPVCQDKSGKPISDSHVFPLGKTQQSSKDDKRTESWYCLPQELDTSPNLDTSQPRFNMRKKGTEMADFPSLEEGVMTQSENQVKEPNRDPLYSPLLVTQDSFASPDLPLLTCLTQGQEFEPDSLFQQSELDFAFLRGLPGKSEDTEWFSRPSEVSEALFQAASEVASDLVNNCYRVSQHLLTGSTVESLHSFSLTEQGTEEEAVSCEIFDELKIPKHSDHNDALCSDKPWTTKEVPQELETVLADKSQVSVSTLSSTSDGYIEFKGNENFDVSCSVIRFWIKETLQQLENYFLANKNQDSLSDSEKIDENEIPKGRGNFNTAFSCMPWSKQRFLCNPETGIISKDYDSFPHEVAPSFDNKMPYSLMCYSLERGGKGVSLMSDSHYFESVSLGNPSENDMKQMDYERYKEDPGEECFELKENRNTLVISGVHPRNSKVECVENTVPHDSVNISETHMPSREHGTSKIVASPNVFQMVTSTLEERPEQLSFQEETNQKTILTLSGKNVGATENTTVEAVTAFVESSETESRVNKIQTGISEPLTNDSQESKQKNPDHSFLNYNEEKSVFGEFKHSPYHSISEVFEQVSLKPLLDKEDDDRSQFWHCDLKPLPGAPWEMLIKPFFIVEELKSSSLSEKSHSYALDLDRTHSHFFQSVVNNEPFLPVGKMKSVSALNLTEEVGSSDIFDPLKVSSDSLVLQDSKHQTIEEISDSSNSISCKNVSASEVIDDPPTAVESSFSGKLVACNSRSQSALPLISNALLTLANQETLLKAEIDQCKILWPGRTRSNFSIYAVMQNDSYFIEGLQGKTESDICILEDDSLCSSLDENALVCSEIERAVEQQREVDHSRTDSSQTFSSVLPPFVREPTTKSDYHSVDLRMLRISSDAMPDTHQYLAGSTSRGGIAKITQSNLKPGITSTTSGDSDFESLLSLSPEDIPQLSVRSPQEYITGQYSDSLNQRIFSHLAEETLKVSAVPELAEQKTEKAAVPFYSYSRRDKQIFPQQELPDSHLPKEILKVSFPFESADQKTGIPIRSSDLDGEKSHIVNQSTLSDSHLIEQTQGVSSIPGFSEQTPGIQKIPSSAISQREKPIFYQQELQDSHFTEQSQNIPIVPGLASQKTGILKVTPPLYPQKETSQYFLPQEFPDHHLTEEDLKVSAVLGLPGQKPGRPFTPSSSFSKRGKLKVVFHQEVPESPLTDEALKVSSVTGLIDQQTGRPLTLSTSYIKRGTPSLVFHQEIPDEHIREEGQKDSSVPDQETGRPTTPSTYNLQRGKHSLVYQQVIPESHQTEEVLRVFSGFEFPGQETEGSTTSSASASGKPSLVYQQEVPASHLTEEALKVSSFPDQKTGRPVTSSTSTFQRGKPYQQEIPASHLTEEALRVSSVLGPAGQEAGRPITPSKSSFQRGKTSLVYQQEIPDSHPAEGALKVSSFPDQETGRPITSSTSTFQRGKPSIVYQQEIPASHLTEEALKVSSFSDQDTGRPITSSTSSFQRGKPSIVYQQEIPASHPAEEALNVSSVLGLAGQETGRSVTPSTSIFQRGRPSLVYQQEIPDSHLTEEVLKVPAFPDQETGRPITSSTSSLQRGKPSIVYQQEIPASHPAEEALEVSPVLGPAGRETGRTITPSTSFFQRGKPSLVYQQEIPDSHLTKEVLKVSSVLGLTDQETGRPVKSSTSTLQTGKPNLVYQQEIPESHPTEEALKVSPVFGLPSQGPRKPVTPPTSSFQRRKPSLVYQQEIPASHLTEEALKVSSVLGLSGQETGRPITPLTPSFQKGKPNLVYQQEIPDSRLTEEALKVSSFPDQETGRPITSSTSSPQRGKPSIVYQQEIPDGRLTEEALKVSSFPDQETGRPITSSTSSSQRGKPSIVYQQEKRASHLTEEALKVSSFPDQETGRPITSSTSSPQRGKPSIVYQQEIPAGHLTEEALKVSSIPELARQDTGRPLTPSTLSFQRGKPSLVYQQEIPDSRLTEEALKVSSFPDQETGRPITSSTSSPQRGKPSAVYQQEIPDGHLTEEALKVSSFPDQETGSPITSSPSSSQRGKPSIVYQQEISVGHLTEEALKVSSVPGPGQETGRPLTPSISYSERGKPRFLYQQEIPESHLTEEGLKVSPNFVQAGQETGRPISPSTSSLQRGKPRVIYHQEIADSHLTAEGSKISSVLELPRQDSRKPITPSTSSFQRGKPSLVYQQEIPESHLTEEALKVWSFLGLSDQEIGRPVTSSTSSLQSGKPSLDYQQETGRPITPSALSLQRAKPRLAYQRVISDSNLTEEALKVSSVLRLTDQETGSPRTSSSFTFQRGKPSLVYQQEIPESHLTEEVLKVSSFLGLIDQETGRPITSSTSTLQRGKPSLVYQLEIPDSHLTEEALKVSSVLGVAGQETGRPLTPSTLSFQRGKPSLVYQQEIPVSHLTEEALRVSSFPDQETGRPITPSTSTFQRGKPSLVYQQEVSASHLTEETRNIFSVPELTDQKTGRPIAPSASSLQRGKHSIVYQQEIPESHLTEEAIKVSSLGLVDQETGIQTVPSSPYSQREKPTLFNHQGFPDSPLIEEGLRVSSSGPLIEEGLRVSSSGQSPGIPVESSRSKVLGVSSGVFYQQSLPGSHLSDKVLKVSGSPGSAEIKSRLPSEVSSLYLSREKPGIFYQQDLPVHHLTEQAKKISPASRPTDQRTGISTVTSYSHREKPFHFYPQDLSDRQLSEESHKVLPAPRSAEWKTELPLTPSSSSSPREKPIILYPQDLPDLNLVEDSLNGLAVSGEGEQKTGKLTDSSSFIHSEKTFISSPPGLPDTYLPDESKVLTVSHPVDQKTGLPSEPSSIYPHREKSIIFYQQGIEDSHSPEEALKIFTALEPSDRKTSLPFQSSSYAHREKPISYQQVLPGSHLTEPVQKVSSTPGSADLQRRKSPVSSSSLSREKPIISYQQQLPGRLQTDESPKVSGVRPIDQKFEKSTVPSSSSSHIKKHISSYQPKSPDLTEEALQILGASLSSDKEGGISRLPFSSYSQREIPVVYRQQGLVYELPTEETLSDSTSGPADQKSGTSPLYSQQEKPIVFHQPGSPDRHLNEEVLKFSATGPADQQPGISRVPLPSFSQSEEPLVFHHPGIPDTHLTEETQKVSATPERSDQQKTRIPEVISPLYAQGEKSISYRPELLGSRQSETSPKVSGVPGPVDQKIVIPTLPSSLYSHIEKPISSYQQKFPDLTAKALQILEGSQPADQRTGVPGTPTTSTSSNSRTGILGTPTSYPHKKEPIVSYQQELPESNEDTLKLFELSGAPDQKTGERVVPFTSKLLKGVPVFTYGDLADITDNNLKVSAVPGLTDQETGKQTIPSRSYSYRKKTGHFDTQELPALTEQSSKVNLPGPADQKTGKQTIPSRSYSHRKKTGQFYTQELPALTEQSSKVTLPGPADQKTEIPTEPPSSYLHKDKVKISTLFLPDDHKTEFCTTPSGSYFHREEPKNLTVIEADNQKHSSEVFPKSYRVKPSVSFQQQLPDKQSGDTAKILIVPGTTEVNSGMHREIPDIFCSPKLPGKHLIEDTIKFSGDTGQADRVTGLLAVPRGIYSHSEKHKLVSDHVQKLIDNLDSSNSSVSSNIPLSSQADDRVILSKPESSDFEGVGSDEIQDLNGDSRTLKEIRTLLMEAENIALKRCHFLSPLVPFRDVSDISIIQAKKVVSFKEPPSADEYIDDVPQRQPFREESPRSKNIQKDISTQTSHKCQRGIENRELISSATVRSPRQEAESKARMTVDETLRRYKSARSVRRSDPDICSRTFGSQIVIPVVTILKNDSSSDVSSCSWDSNSLESVSDVFLNFFPCASKTSMTDSREEEGLSESDDGGGSSVDSLAARVKSLLKCESSLNHAKQILRKAEKEECRVRARAWNLKFNLAREYECGYSISELNEDDRKKVEEIKEKFFIHGRTADLSKSLQSSREVGCKPEAVCSHIIIESHEKGCFSTVAAEQPQLDTDPCALRFAEPSEVIRGQQSPSWRTRHINLCRSLDQNNSSFNIWNPLQFPGHSPFQNFTADDFKMSKGLQMSFHENVNPWLLELEEPECVLPEEIDCHSSQMLLPEPMKQVTTSITFASHQHSACFSDSSVLNVDVAEGSQCAGTSWGLLNSHFMEEQSPPRDTKQQTLSPSLYKIIGHSPDKTVTILEDSGGQNKKLLAEHFYQEENLSEKSDFKCSPSDPHIHAHYSKNKEVHFSENPTLIRMGSPLAAKEKTVTVTPDLPSHIFLEQRELFEQYTTPRPDSARKQHSLPPQHQNCIVPNLTGHASLEKEEKNRAPHIDHHKRDQSPFMQSQDCKTSNTPHSIFLEQRKLFEKSKIPDVDCRVRKDHPSLPQVQEYVVEKKNQHKSKSQVSNRINVEAGKDNAVPQSKSNQFTLVASTPIPPLNRKALSCVRITLGPKTSPKLDSGTLDKSFQSSDSASKTRMNHDFNSDLQMVSSKLLEPTSKLLNSKPKAQDQETSGFIKPPSDVKVALAPLPENNLVTQDLKTKPLQNSQIVTSRQTQVNISDLEGYHNSDGAPLPVSADRPPEENKISSTAFSGKLSSDAVTQITTESPDKTLFSSEIFITDKDLTYTIQDSKTYKSDKSPLKFASSSSIQKISVPHAANAQPFLLPYKPSASTDMYYVQQVSQIPGSLASKSDTTIESSHSGSNDAIAPDFPAQALGTRDDEAIPVNIKHSEGIYSKRAVTKAKWPVEEKTFPKDNAVGSNDAIAPDFPAQALGSRDDEAIPVNTKHSEGIYSKRSVTKANWPVEQRPYPKDNAVGSNDAIAPDFPAQALGTGDDEAIPVNTKHSEGVYSNRSVTKANWPVEQRPYPKDNAVGSNDAIAADFPAQALGTRDDEAIPVNTKHSEGVYSNRSVTKANWPVEQRPYPKDNAVGSNDAIAPDFPAQALGTRDDEAIPVNTKHSEGVYSNRSVTKANWPVEQRPYPKDNAVGSNDAIAADFPAQALGTGDDEAIPVNMKHSEGIYSKRSVTKANWPVEERSYLKNNGVGSNDAIAADFPAQALGTRDDEAIPLNTKYSEGIYSKRSVTKANWPVEQRPYPKDNAVGSNDAIAPDFPAQALGIRDDEAIPVNMKHSEGIYSKRSVTKANWPVEERPYLKNNGDVEKDGSHKEEIGRGITKTAQPQEVAFLQKQPEGSSDDAASQYFAHQQSTKVGSLPDYKTIEQKEDIQIPLKTAILQEPWSKSKESLQLDTTGSEYPSEIENTTHSVFKSARFFIHHPVHLSNDQDIGPESLERSVFMKHSLQDFIQQHPENHEKHAFLPPHFQDVEKTKKGDSRIENLGIGMNLENKEGMRTAKNQTKTYLECEKPIRYSSRDRKITPEETVQHTVSLNELWNKYMERQRLQKTPDFCVTKGLSLVERLDRLAKLLQNPITHSLLPSESTQDDSRGEQDVNELSCRQQQQKNKLQKKKRYKYLEKCHKYTGDVRKRKVLSNHEAARANQIKIEQIKFDKYILRKKPGYRCTNNTSSDSRPSEESDLLTDTATNILSTTSSPVDSDILTQTDKEVTLHERSSSISTIDTARLIQAFGHERVCLSPKQIKLYRNIADHQRRCLEKRNKKNKKMLNVGHPLMISDHTKRKQIQVTSGMVPSDSISSSISSSWSSNSVICNKEDVKMLHKGIQAGNLEIVHGVREHTRDVGMTFPTPSSSKGRAEEENGIATLSEEKRFLSSYCRNKKLRKNKPICFEGVSWFIPVENVKSGPRKENLPMAYGPGISWFAPITTTKPWREPLREQNQQEQYADNHKPLAGPPRPFVKATLQEALQLHRPDFISRSGERVKRLKLIVEERKLQNVLQSEREALFNTRRDGQTYRDTLHLFPKRGIVPAKMNGPIGKKEMILRSKRIYEQLPEVQRKRDEEKRKSEYTSYRLRAQLYKKKVTNHLLGRKVPWD